MTFWELLRIIKTDLQHHNGIGLARIYLAFVYNQSFRLLLNYRLGSFLVQFRNIFTNLLILNLKRRQMEIWSCDISYNSQIGRNVAFPHPLGIVIGEGVVIKDDVKIWQHVTLGSHGRPRGSLMYPVIEDRVRIYTGAVVLGDAVVGKGAIVGANAVVIESVPPFSTVVGVPAKNITKL